MNFTGNPSQYQFNPYLDTIQADALTRVELQKQEQFNQGYQQIQGQFSSIMGLPIAKQETKDYIQSKLTQLKNNIASSTTGDFGDMRLINQIGGLTGRIANDPIVQNGVQSTARAQKAFQQMDEDRKAGKLTPQNEARFMDQYSQWANDGRADSVFEGSYIPYTDYMKKFIDLYKEIHPDSSLTQNDVRVNDQSGQIEVLNERTHEGIDAATVNSLWSQVMSDPTVQNQLSIDAWYRYRGMDGDSFAKHVKDSYQGNLKNIESKVQEIQKRAAIDKTLDAREASQAITALKNTGSQYVDQYNQIGKLIESGDIDQAKTALFTTNLSSSLASNFSWSKDTDKIVDSPFWKAHMDQVNYELNLKKFDEEKEFHRAELALRAQEILLKGKDKAGAGNTGAGAILGGIDTITSEMPVDEHAGEKGSTSFYDTLKSIQGQYDQAANKLVFNIGNTIPGYKNPVKLDGSGAYVLNIDPTGKAGYKSKEEANKEFGKLWQDARKGIVNGTANPKVVNMFQEVDPLIRKLQNMRQSADKIEQGYKPQMDQLNKFLVDSGIPKETTVDRNGKQVKVDVSDLLNYYVADTKSGEQAKAVEERIKQKFGENGKEFLEDNILTSSGGLGIPKLQKIYKSLKKTLSGNENLIDPLVKREADFKNLQLAFKPLESTILAAKSEEKETVKAAFLGIANSRNLNGDAGDFIDLLTKEHKNSTPADNVYSLDFDRNTGDYYLKVQRAGKTEQLKVTEKDAQNLGFETQNQFWNKFGDNLSLGQNVKTDINNTGISSAYIMDRPSGSKYQVKYHLIGNGQGNYDMALYVQSNPGKGEKVKDYTVQQPIMLGQWLSQNEIMQIVNRGIPDQALDALLFGK